MDFLERMVERVDEQFSLGANARPLLTTYLQFIELEVPDGFDGFLRRLCRGGLTEAVESWIGPGAGTEITGAQLDWALGPETLIELADRVGVPHGTARDALAYVTPRLVDALTPDGEIPTSLPGWASTPPSGPKRRASEVLRQGPVSNPFAIQPPLINVPDDDPVKQPTPNAVTEPHPPHSRRGRLGEGWITPIALLAIVALIGWGSRQAPAPPTRPKPKPAQSPVAVAPKQPTEWTLIKRGPRVEVFGSLASREAVIAVETEAEALDGEASVDLRVETDRKGEAWRAKLPEALVWLRGRDAELNFRGNIITVAAREEQSDLVNKLQEAFGPAVRVQPLDLERHTAEANAAALSALESLTPEAPIESVLAALNLQVIHFRSGSARIPEANEDILRLTAEVITRVSPAARFEIQGHTDSQGRESANVRLSQRRAESVRRLLVENGVAPDRLSAVGRGPSEPIADNRTAEGRYRNRRITFALAENPE